MSLVRFAGGRGLFTFIAVFFVSIDGVARAAGAPAAMVPSPTSERYIVRVMTFNIRVDTILDGFHGWSNRREMVCRTISRFRPGILGLQEPLRHQVDDILQALGDYALIGVGRKDGKTKGQYSCILYRTDRFSLLDSGTFWLSDTPETPGSITWGNFWTRICTWARLANRWTGRAFYVYNVHLDNISQRSREKSVQLLSGRIHDRDYKDPFIVTGDFNAGEDNVAVRFLKGQTVDGLGKAPLAMKDTYRLLNPHLDKVGTQTGFMGIGGNKKIDYIFAGPHIKVLQAEIMRIDYNGRYPSDHFPVTATLLID